MTLDVLDAWMLACEEADAPDECAIGLFMVAVWRIAHLMRTGRTRPEMDAALFFEPDEIRGTYWLIKKKQPAILPTVNEVLDLIAASCCARTTTSRVKTISRPAARHGRYCNHTGATR